MLPSTLTYRPSALRCLYMIIIGVALLLAGCSGGQSVRHVPHLGNTPYQQDTILVAYATDPERALTLLDSALLLGNSRPSRPTPGRPTPVPSL